MRNQPRTKPYFVILMCEEVLNFVLKFLLCGFSLVAVKCSQMGVLLMFLIFSINMFLVHCDQSVFLHLHVCTKEQQLALNSEQVVNTDNR